MQDLRVRFGRTITIADSSSERSQLFIACTTKRFPLSRRASATKIVRPLESTVAMPPQLQPALLRLSAMISQYWTESRIDFQTLSPCVIHSLFFGCHVALKDSREQMFAESRRYKCRIWTFTFALFVSFQ